MLEPTTKDFKGDLFLELNKVDRDDLEKFVFAEIECLGYI